MEGKKRGFLVLLGVLLSAFSFFALAEDGCYLYPGTGEDLYCHDIARELAEEDCSAYAGCDIVQHFQPGSQCSEFPELCRQVTCSVDCQLHYLGWCEQFGRDEAERRGGFARVTLEDFKGIDDADNTWCALRCCKALPYCSRGLVTRWECLLGAKRQGLDNFEEANAEECGNPVEWCGIALSPGNLTGRVLAAGVPLSSGFTVSLADGTNAVIQASGEYLFENVAPRTHLVTASAEGYASQSREILIGSGQEVSYDFNLLAEGGVTVTGGVYSDEPHAQSIPRATVSWQENGRLKTAVTDAEGAFTISAISLGEHTFTAGKSGFTPQEQTITISEGENIINFVLALSARQGVSGIVRLHDALKLGAIIFINGQRRAFSDINGHYSVELPAGRYDISASSEGKYSYGPEEITIVENEMLDVGISLEEVTPLCGPGNLKAVEVFSGRPVLGRNIIRLEWRKPCPEVVSYELRKFHNGVADDALLSASPQQSFLDDNEVSWGESYEYEIIANYGNNQFSPPIRTYVIYVGDELCSGRYSPAGISETFCLIDKADTEIDERIHVWRCDENNRIASEQCIQHDASGWFCAGVGEGTAACKNGGACSLRAQQAMPFGLYYNRETCYGSLSPEESTANFCYFDYSKSITDTCSSCAKVSSCFDYKSKDACKINSCLTSQCSWLNVSSNEDLLDYSPVFPADYSNPLFVTSETGSGYCVSEEKYKSDDRCSLCGPTEGSSLFKNYYCTGEVCAGLGRCFSKSSLSECSKCGQQPTGEANCYRYQTELECTDYGVGLSIENGKIFDSKDSCGWRKCSWLGTPRGEGSCMKDGDDDDADDCAEVPAYEISACRIDNRAPETSVPAGTPIISTVAPLLNFSAKDDVLLGSLFYCLSDSDASAQDACTPDAFVSNSVLYPVRKEASLSVDLLSSFSQLVDGKTYRMKFYSKDRYHNQEEMKESFVFIDNVLPQFEIESSSSTAADKTDLTVSVIGETEPMGCSFRLQPVLPWGETQEIVKSIEFSSKSAIFEQLEGIYYNVTVTCTDARGNVNSRSKWLTFDLEQRIDIIYPAVGSSLATTQVSFHVLTDVGAVCELRTIADDQKAADFLPDDEWKEHHTELLPGFFEGEYLDKYKVVCRELLDQSQEMEDYFSFVVDFTAPETQIILQEGSREIRPITYSWKEFFVSSADVNFVCDSAGFACDATFYCLGDGCEARTNPNYLLYEGTAALTESTKICYYSTDAGGNAGQPFCGNVIIDGYGITLVSPSPHYYGNEVWGISNSPIFDWLFYTRVPTARCKFDFVSGFNYDEVPQYRILESSAGQYAFAAFPGEVISEFPEEGGVKKIYLKCENHVGELSPETVMNLEYDPTTPNIVKAYAEPAEILEEVKTTLFVDTDDKTMCRYSDDSESTGSREYGTMEFSFPGEEQKLIDRMHQDIFSISFVGPKKDYVLATQCRNGAEDLSDISEIFFAVDYSQAGYIIPGSLLPEGYIGRNDATLSVNTSKNAICEYRQDNVFLPFSGSGGRFHTKEVSNLSESHHTYLVRCTMGDHVAEAQIKFTVDLTSPKVTSINDGNRTCGLQELSAFVYTDDENVTQYYYELFEKAVPGGRSNGTSPAGVISSGVIAVEQPIRIGGLNLTEGNWYAVRVKAGDAAGNLGNYGESDGVLATFSNDSVCEADKAAPFISLVVNESCTNVRAELHCEDEVGCRSILYGTERTSSLCSALENYNGKSILFESTGWLCYDAVDNTGNNGSGLKQVIFKDEDGDGISDGCDQCPDTSSGRQVSDEGCASGEVPRLLGTEDMDGDGLPDSWEEMYNKEGCEFDPQKEDSDGNGISDHDEDYDGDGYNNYAEYLGHTDPCSASDMPSFVDKKEEEDERDRFPPVSAGEEEPDILAWIFFIIGLLLTFGGTGYLIYYYYYSPSAVSAPSRSSFAPLAMKETAEPVALPEWKRLLLQKRRARESKDKERARRGIFSSFSGDSKEIPHVKSALKEKAGPLSSIKSLAEKYVAHKEDIQPGLRREEKGVFAELEKIANLPAGGKGAAVSKEKARDIFDKLKELSEKRKGSRKKEEKK